MLFSCIASKAVISQMTGTCIGHVTDMDIDPFTLQVIFIKVRPLFNIFNIRRCFRCIIIPIINVVKIGEDVIIVNLFEGPCPF